MQEEGEQFGLSTGSLQDAVESQEYAELSTEEQERYNKSLASLAEIERARTEREEARKWRTLFDNAPPETLPFIIYCTYVSVNALGAAFLLINATTQFVLIYVIILGAMVFPLFALPSNSFRDSISWLRTAVARWRE